MSVISPSPVSVAIRQALQASIAEAVSKGKASITEELMGYTLAGFATAETYQPPSFVPAKRHIAVPEILTGSIAGKST